MLPRPCLTREWTQREQRQDTVGIDLVVIPMESFIDTGGECFQWEREKERERMVKRVNVLEKLLEFNHCLKYSGMAHELIAKHFHYGSQYPKLIYVKLLRRN